jgi:predicted homoserine dehydrogenase-like protein
VHIGQIGAGKFGAMYLAQIPRTPGVQLVAVADLLPDAARASFQRVGCKPERIEARSAQEALKDRQHLDHGRLSGRDARAGHRYIVLECTGNPVAALDHCLDAFAHGKHVVNVTVEADAFRGPLLARRAQHGRRVLARLRRPAGADLRPGRLGTHLRLPGGGGRTRPQVAAALQRLDARHGVGCGATTGLTPEQALRGGLNPKMFNSFLDGAKPSIESAAVANATGLGVPSHGLRHPAASVEDSLFVTRPKSESGVLERKGVVEVMSSLRGRWPPHPLRHPHGSALVGVEAETEYISNCFDE